LGMHTSSDRDRFTIGHELGHYVLHYLYPQAKGSTVSPTKADRYGTGRTEYEANWFAASFLMPHEAFKIAYNSARGNLCEVAEKFHVSLSAASVRARALTLE
jgi:Zn-dependent peptidase ImmA (M78 family)